MEFLSVWVLSGRCIYVVSFNCVTFSRITWRLIGLWLLTVHYLSACKTIIYTDFCLRHDYFLVSITVCSRNDMKIKILQFYFRSSKKCPGYRGFPAPKTKFLHVSLSLISSSVRPWLVIIRLTPVIHLSLGLPFFASLSFFFCVFYVAFYFPAVSLCVQTVVTVFLSYWKYIILCIHSYFNGAISKLLFSWFTYRSC